MSEYVVCPKRGEAKVSLQVCISVCDSREDCEEFKEVPEADLEAAMKKMGKMPAVSGDSVVGETEIVDEGKGPKSSEKDAEEASRLLHKAISIKNEIEGKFWEMGAILNGIFKNQYYVDYGYHDWKDFCNEVLEMRWRTATYLRDIYVKFTSLGVSPEDCVGVGWGKLKELLPIVTKENVKYWIDEAKKKKVSVAVLNAKVRYALGRTKEDQSDSLPQQLVFRLHEAQLENVERALEIARRMTGSDSRGYHLEIIAAEFRATYEGVSEEFSKAKIVSSVFSRVESSMRVKFQGSIVDPETGEILIEAK